MTRDSTFLTQDSRLDSSHYVRGLGLGSRDLQLDSGLGLSDSPTTLVSKYIIYHYSLAVSEAGRQTGM